MAMDLKEIESLIKEALTDATIEIQDLNLFLSDRIIKYSLICSDNS